MELISNKLVSMYCSNAVLLLLPEEVSFTICSAFMHDVQCLLDSSASLSLVRASPGLTIGVFAGEAALRVWAAGPADVEMERTGASEYMAMLTAAGTYTIKATLDGAMLPGQPLWPLTLFFTHFSLGFREYGFRV